MVGLPGSAEAGETRLYALVLKRLRENEWLYVMVRDPAHQRVLGLLPLGSYLPMEAPEVTTDKAGALHILYRNAPQVFGYACIDGNAKVLETAAYSDAGSAPHFAADDEGAVKVQGGQKVVPGAAPVLVPQPAPPPPKKKKWWWPFGGGSTNQTATAQSPAK
jgi:hypothetical protein